MKFKNTMKSKSSVKRQKIYDFNLNEKDINYIKRATYDVPHLFRITNELSWFLGYIDHNDEISIRMMHSFDVFVKIEED